MKVLADILQEIVDKIVRTVHPDTIVLFGSNARGNAGPDSDIDLLVVVPGAFTGKRSRENMYGDLVDKLEHYCMPVDILLFTQSEVREWKPFRNHVISRAFREGRVLYEHKNPDCFSDRVGKIEHIVVTVS